MSAVRRFAGTFGVPIFVLVGVFAVCVALLRDRPHYAPRPLWVEPAAHPLPAPGGDPPAPSALGALRRELAAPEGPPPAAADLAPPPAAAEPPQGPGAAGPASQRGPMPLPASRGSCAMTPRVDELTLAPSIGQTYLVPCVLASLGGPPDWYPVFGPVHADPEIGMPARHWHLDRRFLTEPQARILATHDERDPIERALGATMPLAALLQALVNIVITEKPGREGIAWRPLPCLRDQPAHVHGAVHEWIFSLEAAYASERVVGHRCPHKGMPLGGLPRKGGCVTCPAHGLRWGKDGRLVPRAPAERAEIQRVADAMRRLAPPAGRSR